MNRYESDYFEKLIQKVLEKNIDGAYSPVRGLDTNDFSRSYNKQLLNGEYGQHMEIASNHGVLLKKSIFVDLNYFYEKFIYAGEDTEFYMLVKDYLYITIRSIAFQALSNVVLNFLMIPIWKENAAAFTTLIAEAISFFGCTFFGKKYVSLTEVRGTTLKVLVGCAGIVLTSGGVMRIINNVYMSTVVTVCSSIFVYLVIEVILKNESIWSILNSIKAKISK